MTAANPSPAFFANLLEALRSAGRFIARVALGGLALLAAGVVALTMAVLGLLIAAAALIFRFSRRDSIYTHNGSDTYQDEGVVTLEARQTGRGWTVE